MTPRMKPAMVVARCEPLIKQGLSWAKIATKLGYANRHSAQTSYHRAARQLGLPTLETRYRGRRDDLPSQQVMILRLLAEGLWLPEIAKRLGVATSTVKNHSKRLYLRIGARNAHHAVAIAYERHLLDDRETS